MSLAAPAPAQARAAKSSFYLAMRLMPATQRQAMFEIYSFCRAVDDIADDGAPREAALAGLQGWRDDLAALYAGSAPARLGSLAEAVAQFGLKQEDFLAVIDGMEMDVERTVGAGATDWATLDLYCDRVASAVGRLSAPVFGMNAADGVALAHHLGRALQLANILRDIDEDAAIDRLYLPVEALREAGVAATGAQATIDDPNIEQACLAVAARARQHFAAAQEVFDRTPAAVARTPRIMGEAYRHILDRLTARGWKAPRAPLKLGKMRLLLIVARCFLA
ncbi:MAG TPA: presqualene diphosphate synthase HpnD [Roseiarcus sp.]|nr:presqualene diphosphate synthase HpnD [Roseiarcus sp.]